MLSIIFYIFLTIHLSIIMISVWLRLSRFLNRKNFDWFNNFKQRFFNTMNYIGLFKHHHLTLTETNETVFNFLTTNIDFQSDIRLLFETKINVIKHKSDTPTSFWNSTNIWSRFDMIFSLIQFLPMFHHKPKWYFIKIKLVYILFYASIICFLLLSTTLLCWCFLSISNETEKNFLKLVDTKITNTYLFINLTFYAVNILLLGWVLLFMLAAFFWSSIIETYINKINQYKILNIVADHEKFRLKWLFLFCNILICSQSFKLINDNFKPPLIIINPPVIETKEPATNISATQT